VYPLLWGVGVCICLCVSFSGRWGWIVKGADQLRKWVNGYGSAN